MERRRPELWYGLVASATLSIAALTGCNRSAPPADAPASESAEASAASAAPATPPPGASMPPAARAVLDDVRRTIVDFPVGNHTLAAYDFPDDFLDRLAVRLLRETVREGAQVVFRDPAARPEVPDDPGVGDPDEIVHSNLDVRVLRRSRVPELNDLPAERPERRSFKAQWQEGRFVPPVLPEDLSDLERAQADLIATRLAPDGLRSTIEQVLELRRRAGSTDALEDISEELDRLGLPVDLLADDPDPPGFRIATESGEHPIEALRLQLTRGRYWQGAGAGGCLDLARQLADVAGQAEIVANIETRHLAAFCDLVTEPPTAWPPDVVARLRLVPQDLPVAQWAQDNAKAGFVESGTRRGMLVPRYPSRREDGSVFVPGEALASAAIPESPFSQVVQSTLLFQGGNLLPVRDPAGGERILLVGEAEIYRNTALGLTRHQAVEAFRVEFGVDRCIVLPGVSFHIDYDVTVRAHDGRLIAFVNDHEAAVPIILAAGMPALERAGVLSAEEVELAQRVLAEGRYPEFLQIIGPLIFAQRTPQGYPLSFAEHFSVSAVDSPVGNLQRFLTAIDELIAMVSGDRLPPDPTAAAYFASFAMTRADRQLQERILRELGMEIVRVPSFAEADRSIVAVNGVHVPGLYLMPAYGGLYAPLDEAAAAAFRARLGDEVAVVPILCGESMRRSGAVHCSVSVLPSVAE